MIDLETFESWLKELHRCLTPNGALIFTFHGLNAFEKIEDKSMSDSLNIKYWEYKKLRRKIDEDEFVWLEQSVGSSDIDNLSYGISFTTKGFIEKLTKNLFIVFDFKSSVGGWQDLIVLKKI